MTRPPKLTLIRGLPGSGKTTLARTMVMAGTASHHIETDMFWGPQYQFDAAKIKEAHEWCQKGVITFFEEHADSIVVSNTFTTAWEMLPYFDMAKQYKADVQVILCQGQFGSIHNVPAEVILKMSARFEYDISHLWVRLND